jgi:ribose/xylose/arabinose/galactoside ABC-type transport system permease subunit
MLSVIAGIALVWTNGSYQLGDRDSLYSIIGKSSSFGIPSYIFIFIFLAILLAVILQKTTLGRNIYLIGTNIEAAKAAGIKVNLIKIVTFIISGICVAIAAIILSSRMSSATPVGGVGYEFNAITAVLIGGNSLFGGKGSIYNTILGVLLLGVLMNAMILLDMPIASQSILKGLLVIVAVFFDVRARAELEKV